MKKKLSVTNIAQKTTLKNINEINLTHEVS